MFPVWKTRGTGSKTDREDGRGGPMSTKRERERYRGKMGMLKDSEENQKRVNRHILRIHLQTHCVHRMMDILYINKHNHRAFNRK